MNTKKQKKSRGMHVASCYICHRNEPKLITPEQASFYVCKGCRDININIRYGDAPQRRMISQLEETGNNVPLCTSCGEYGQFCNCPKEEEEYIADVEIDLGTLIPERDK